MVRHEEMNVNELSQLIKDHFQCNSVIIQSALIAPGSLRFHPTEVKIAIGGVLTLGIDVFYPDEEETNDRKEREATSGES